MFRIFWQDRLRKFVTVWNLRFVASWAYDPIAAGTDSDARERIKYRGEPAILADAAKNYTHK